MCITRRGLSVLKSDFLKENAMVLKDHIHCMKGAIPDNMAASVRKWRANMTSIFGKMISATRLVKPCARVTNMMAIKALSPTISDFGASVPPYPT